MLIPVLLGGLRCVWFVLVMVVGCRVVLRNGCRTFLILNVLCVLVSSRCRLLNRLLCVLVMDLVCFRWRWLGSRLILLLGLSGLDPLGRDIGLGRRRNRFVLCRRL